MILIDTSGDDASTNDVLDWLFYLQKESRIHRSNGVQKLSDFSVYLSSGNKFNFKYNTRPKIIDSSIVSSYWYRRGINTIDNYFLSSIRSQEEVPYKSILNHLSEENKAVFDILNKLKGDITLSVGNFKNNLTNKLTNLITASKCGLLIPETLVSSNKIEIVDFINKYRKVIVKNISQAPFIQEQISETLLLSIDFENLVLDKSDWASIAEDEYGFSFFQKYIEKKLELRVFYLNDFFYTTAIFSQANERTKIDYRNYDQERPNRTVPFDLPVPIKNKISKLMKLLDMNSGSIDMIYATNSKFYFLEINPIGQFQGNERRCNFYISKLIASFLAQTPPIQ